jgi:Protein of unknown function (DUF1091)
MLIAHKAELKFNEKVINLTSQLVNMNGSTSFNCHGRIHVQVDSLVAQVSIALPSSSGKFDKFIQNSSFDVCQCLKNPNANMFLRLFFNGKFTSKLLPTSCPIAPGEYFMEGFEVDEKLLSIRGLQTKFLMLIDWGQRVDGKLNNVVNLKFYGELKDRKK